MIVGHKKIVMLLERARPGASWGLSGDTLDGLVWHDATTPPDEAELSAHEAAIDETLLWEPVRTQRDALLATSDWTQMPDGPLPDAKVAEWAAYRSHLRSIPQDYATPDEVVWPTPPA